MMPPMNPSAQSVIGDPVILIERLAQRLKRLSGIRKDIVIGKHHAGGVDHEHNRNINLLIHGHVGSG